MTILEKIINQKQLELKNYELSNHEMKSGRQYRSLLKALRGKNLTIIAEIKMKSPSEGTINKSLDPIQIAKDYESAGASAISVLTDLKYFGGSIKTLEKISEAVNIPVIRKDFIIDKLQIIEASNSGADSYLLISDILSKNNLKELYNFGKSKGMDILLEIHNENNLEKIKYLNPNIVGVNCRNLNNMITSKRHFKDLFNHLPKKAHKVAESGLKNMNDLKYIYDLGYNSALIGSSLMKTKNPGKALEALTSGLL